MDDYLTKDQQDTLKGQLYGYLQDKASRKAMTGNSKSYEAMQNRFADQERLYDTGALLGAMSEGASMSGTLGGKRSESNIVPTVNKALYESAQGSIGNMARLMDEERAGRAEDLGIAKYITDLERADDANKLASRKIGMEEEAHKSRLATEDLKRQELQKRLEGKAIAKARFQPGLLKDGSPVVMDEFGNPRPLPGYQIDRKAMPVSRGAEGHWVPAPEAGEADGEIAQRNSITGEIRKVPLPPGFKKKEKAKPEKIDQVSERNKTETLRRYNNLVSNAGQLKDLINKYGTFELTGSAGPQMDSLIYQLAVDYAKLVDPTSVAREGEVASAKKYMLPVRDLQGLTVRNKTAIDIIDNYVAGLQRRLEADRAAQEGVEYKGQAPTGTAIDPDKMSDEEVDAELRRRGKIK